MEKVVSAMIRTRYYLGLTTRDGKPVTKAQQGYATERMASAYGGGCTVYRATGYWQGVSEGSLVLEALADDGPDSERPVPEVLARELGTIMLQDTVLWTAERVEAGFVKVPR